MKALTIFLLALAFAGCGSTHDGSDNTTRRQDVESPAAADAKCAKARGAEIDFYVNGEFVLACVPVP